MSKGRPAAELLSCLCSCQWPVRILVRTRVCGLLGGVLGGWERGRLELAACCCCCRGGTERRLGRGQRGLPLCSAWEERSRCGAVGWRSWVCWGKMALLHGEGPSLLEEEETKGQRGSGRSLFLTEGKGATATGFLLAEGKWAFAGERGGLRRVAWVLESEGLSVAGWEKENEGAFFGFFLEPRGIELWFFLFKGRGGRHCVDDQQRKIGWRLGLEGERRLLSIRVGFLWFAFKAKVGEKWRQGHFVLREDGDGRGGCLREMVFFLGLGFFPFVPPLNFLRPRPCKFFPPPSKISSPFYFHCSIVFIGEVLLGF